MRIIYIYTYKNCENLFRNKILFEYLMYLSARTQTRLAHVIAAIAEGEKRTEMVRQVLAEQKMFEPYTTFRRLDQLRTGELTSADLVDFLADNKITVSNPEAQYLFRRFDVNRDGRITYPEYTYIFFSLKFLNKFCKGNLTQRRCQTEIDSLTPRKLLP